MNIIELKLSEDGNGEGITAISLVKHPAIEQTWITFSEGGEVKPNPHFAFKVLDKEQRIVAGPAMVPDKLIIRMGEDGEEFFVFFKADTIRDLSEKFLLQGRQNNMTLEHEATINDLSVVESWIVEDPKRDKSQVYGFDLPMGSWFVKIKVLNDDVWQLVKNKDIEGFSVEGVFAKELIKQSEIMKEEKKTKLDVYLSKIQNLFSDEKEVEEKKEEVKAEKFASIEVIASDGSAIEINYEGETLEPGLAITHTVEGEEVAVPSGEYTLPDGQKLIVAEDGVVGEIVQGEQEEEMKQDGLKADKIDALIDGIAEIVVNFKKQVKEDFEKAIEKSESVLREEFNRPGDDHKKETPEGVDKKEIIKGLNKFVSEAKK